MSTMYRDTNVTAYALGELSEEEARALEPTLTPEEHAEIASIREVASLLSTARSGDGLDANRRAAIDAAIGAVPETKRPAQRRPRWARRAAWVVASGGIAAALLVTTTMMFTQQDARMIDPEAYGGEEISNAVAASAPPPPRPKRIHRTGASAFVAESDQDPDPTAYAVLLDTGTNETLSIRTAEVTTDPAPLGAEYDPVFERGFSVVKERPVTTLAVDVDTASYANVRRHLLAGQLPPKDAVRVEEMINYFDYTLPAPSGAHPLAIVADVTDAPWNPDHLVARVALSSKKTGRRQRVPANLVFLVDVSGSMAARDKLPLVKRALLELVPRLEREDRVALVTYADRAHVRLPSTSGARRAEIEAAIRRLRASGATNGSEGLDLAYTIAARSHLSGGANRVIIATDGDFNVGATGRDAITQLVQGHAKSKTFLTVLGLGSDLKDGLLEHLADRNDGHYAVIDRPAEARKVLVEQLDATLAVVAKDVKVQLELNPRRVAQYRLIGYENRRLANTDFSNDAVDGGEIGAGHTVTMLYELIPERTHDDDQLVYGEEPAPNAIDKRNDLFRVRVRYKAPEGEQSRVFERSVHSWKGHYLGASHDLRFATAVAAFGMKLSDSPYRGRISYEAIASLAKNALGDDPHGRRRELVQLVEIAARSTR